MHPNDVVGIARDALTKRTIVDVDHRKTVAKSRNGRKVFVVVFDFRKQPGVILLPASIMVEVDEETGEATFIESP